MKKFIKESIKVIVALICGLIIGTLFVNADILLGSSNVGFDNGVAGLKNQDNSDVTTVQQAVEAINRKADTVGCPSGYEMASLGNYNLTCRTTGAPICKRATTLHTETCENGSSSDNNYCYADGYYVGGTKNTTTITYGNLGTLGQNPVVGDAFDCDVNGDGIYNSETERFYYVSDYFDTNTQTFDNTRGVLVYYRNFASGSPSDGGVAYYASVNENWHGPTTAVAALPNNKTNGGTWRNDLLKTNDRKILSCNNPSCTEVSNKTNNGSNTIDTGNTPVYNGKAARLLHLKELVAGCGSMNWVNGELKTCNFIMERTKYANASYGNYGLWFENPYASDSTDAWYVGASIRSVSNDDTSRTSRGARPVIDVLYSNIIY